MNTNLIWPYNQPNSNMTYTLGTGLTYTDLATIRSIVQEEIHKALHPEESRESVTMKFEHDGKVYEGIAYLVEEDAE